MVMTLPELSLVIKYARDIFILFLRAEHEEESLVLPGR